MSIIVEIIEMYIVKHNYVRNDMINLKTIFELFESHRVIQI